MKSFTKVAPPTLRALATSAPTVTASSMTRLQTAHLPQDEISIRIVAMIEQLGKYYPKCDTSQRHKASARPLKLPAPDESRAQPRSSARSARAADRAGSWRRSKSLPDRTDSRKSASADG